jgi:RNAse (barnase) inhibitor barstar
MKYKLEFVKISNEHKFAGVGFAGNIFIILNALEYLSTDDVLYVDMETNECACTEKNLNLFDTKNCWEYYFDQNKPASEESVTTMNSLLPARIFYDNREEFVQIEKYRHIKEKFYNSFKLKDYLIKSLDSFYESQLKDKITLGVQIRLTDMKNYHNVKPVEQYIAKINQILEERKEIQQIFLATDDGSIIDLVRSSVKVPVIYYETMFRADSVNKHLHPYDRFENGPRPYHRYKLGVECIQEIFTLAKCNYLLKADVSSISIVAIILSENLQKVYKL